MWLLRNGGFAQSASMIDIFSFEQELLFGAGGVDFLIVCSAGLVSSSTSCVQADMSIKPKLKNGR